MLWKWKTLYHNNWQVLSCFSFLTHRTEIITHTTLGCWGDQCELWPALRFHIQEECLQSSVKMNPWSGLFIYVSPHCVGWSKDNIFAIKLTKEKEECLPENAGLYKKLLRLHEKASAIFSLWGEENQRSRTRVTENIPLNPQGECPHEGTKGSK